MKERFPGFERCLVMMRSRDPQEQEGGFHALLPLVTKHVTELMDAFIHEEDRGLRCWLLELIGEARSDQCFDVLSSQLRSSDESFRFWAIRGLKKLDTKPARSLLREARSYPFSSVKERSAFLCELDRNERSE